MIELQLKSITEEMMDAYAAFAGVKVGTLVLHCHHETLVEVLMEPPENRISWILSTKAIPEQARRLRLFRPFLNPPPELAAAHAEWIGWIDRAKWGAKNLVAACAKWGAKNLVAACAEWNAAIAKWDGHEQVCVPGCPWNGKTIFPEAYRQ